MKTRCGYSSKGDRNMYYHVRITQKSNPAHDETKLDLTEDQLKERFIGPYEQGQSILINGKIVSPDDLDRILVSQSRESSPRLIAAERAKAAASSVAIIGGPSFEWLAAHSAEDVTDEFIQGPPGNRTMIPGTESDQVLMKKRLHFQLKTLRETLLSNQSGRTHWQTGNALNGIRTTLIGQLPAEAKAAYGSLISPILIDRSGSHTVATEDALRLCHQLISLCITYESSSPDSPARTSSGTEAVERLIPQSQKVFVIHGHDETNTLKLRNLLKERFKLEPIVLKELPSKGRALIEKFEEEASDASFAFALVTPDDLVRIQTDEYAQPRPNVIFELGWFYGRLGRNRVCILFREGSRIHSDLDGVLRIQFRESVEEKLGEIERELRAAGLIE